jgi:AAA15 family ATPase/GTPase
MILRFAAENHRSIAKRQEISFVASGLADSETGLIHTSVVPNEKLLPAIVIYGANASGKSNFLSALNFMCSAVAYSHKRGGPEDKVPRRPFVLDTEWSSKPSKFDTDFAIEGTRYHYVFEVTDTEFVS